MIFYMVNNNLMVVGSLKLTKILAEAKSQTDGYIEPKKMCNMLDEKYLLWLFILDQFSQL